MDQLRWLLLNSKLYKGLKNILLLKGNRNLRLSPESLLLYQNTKGIFNRYDLIVRLMAIEELVGKTTGGLMLYHKMQKSRNEYLESIAQRIKPEDRYQNKQGSLQALLDSINQNGFDHRYPITVSPDLKLVDGSHRLACALHFRLEEITIRKSAAKKVDFGLNWFAHYFDQVEIDQIQARYQALINDVDIKEALSAILMRETQVFGRGTFYQSSEVLGISGQRPTTERYRIYGLDEFLNKHQRVLDIGCNCGFFALEMAKKVKSVVGIEIAGTLVEVGQTAQVYLGQSNVEFIQDNFNRHRFDGKFDFICSFAVHYWLGMDMLNYGKRLFDLLNPGGKVILESQNVQKEDVDWDKKLSLLRKVGFVEVRSGRIKDDGVIERKFTILRKKLVK